METLVAAVLLGLFLWFVVYTAVRGAVGDLRRPQAPFRLAWTQEGRDGGRLEIVNLGGAPVFRIAVSSPPGPAAGAPILEALMLQPGEGAVASVSRAALLPGEPSAGDARVVYVTVRHRASLEEVVAEQRTRVPCLVPAADPDRPGHE